MKILISGGLGFIGFNFIIRNLAKTNIKILNLDKESYSSNVNYHYLLKKNKNYSYIKFDLNKINGLYDIIKSFQPIKIINFAAESHVDKSIKFPKNIILNNITSTTNLLISSQKYFDSLNDQNKKIFRFLQISTDEVYGALKLKDKPFVETDNYFPSSPYSASKASSDHIVQSFYKTYGLPTLLTNCSNNYGPFQNTEKLIPTVIIRALNKKKIPVYGNGNQIRDWLHVNDHCDAIMAVIKKGKVGSNYNIGSNNEIANLDLIKIILDLINKKNKKSNFDYLNLINFVKDRLGHDFRYAIDNSKIFKEIAWEPKVKFSTGIKKTVNWYLDNAKKLQR